MRMWLVLGLFLGGIVLSIVFTDVWRLSKTVWLILNVTPYEQSSLYGKTILVAGDSTGYGTGAKLSSLSIAGLIGGDFPNYGIENISKNGLTTEGLHNLFGDIPVGEDYELILLQIGANDILQKRPLVEVESDMKQILSIAKEHTSKVVLMTAGNVGSARALLVNGKPNKEYQQLTREVRNLFIDLCNEYGINYIDLFAEPEQDLFFKEPKTYLAIDGLHPSSAGYAHWYKKLKPVLNKLLLKND